MAGETPSYNKGPAEARYHELERDRAPYLDRARDCSKLTIPTLIPPDGFTDGQRLPSPFQSIGANGANNLASKLLLTMLPPNEPCFRLRVDNMLYEKAQQAADAEWRSKIEKVLSRCEQTVLGDIESTGDRVVVFEGNLHLLIGGNVLYYDDPTEGLRLFPLSRYVTSRDPMGRPVEIIVHETVSLAALPEDFAQTIREMTSQAAPDPSDPAFRQQDAEVDIYTHVYRTPKRWMVYQECRGQKVPGSSGSYKLDGCPWIPVRMYHIAGENYGRSYFEPILGDLKSLEALMQAIVEGSAAAAKVLLFVTPNGVTRARAVAEAANGDVLEGKADDVTILQLQKHADFKIAFETINMLSDRLKTACLMTDGLRRDAERVTAEEIRAVARELEMALGGVYTVISQEFQLPYIQHRIAKLAKQRRMPTLPKGVVRPTVVTGFDALGRGNDKAKLIEYLKTMQELLGPQLFTQYVNIPDACSRLASAIGINSEGLVKDNEELAQNQQQSMTQGLIEKLGPEAIRQMAPMLRGETPAGGVPNGEG